MNEQEIIKKAILISDINLNLKKDPKFLEVLMDCISYHFEEKEEEMSKKSSNIWLIVKNLKPEHLKEMKELIIPEVFESLGL